MSVRLVAIVALVALAGCIIQPEPAPVHPQPYPGSHPPVAQPAPPAPAPTPPPAAGGQVTTEEITDEAGNVYVVSQGIAGAPGVVGCADGQREAFVDVTAFPRIAGCLGEWEGVQSLRAPPTGRACGDDIGSCSAPADLCAPGWRVCGATGLISDLAQVSWEQCEQAGGGRFSAAISHCATQSGCVYNSGPNATYECYPRGWCSESVCCGGNCGQFGACKDGVWAGKTHIAQGTDQGCGATSSRRAGGVLCCR